MKKYHIKNKISFLEFLFYLFLLKVKNLIFTKKEDNWIDAKHYNVETFDMKKCNLDENFVLKNITNNEDIYPMF